MKLSEILSASWIKFKERPWLCICVLLFTVVLTYAGSTLEELLTMIMGFNIHVITILVGVALYLGQTNISLRLIQGKEVSFKSFFEPWKLFPKALGQHLLIILATIIGIILLIIPGIIAYLALSFAIFFLLDKNDTIIESLRKSWKITKGQRFKLFLYIIAFFFINLGGLICLFVGLLVTLPVTSLAFAEIYRRLTEGEKHV